MKINFSGAYVYSKSPFETPQIQKLVQELTQQLPENERNAPQAVEKVKAVLREQLKEQASQGETIKKGLAEQYGVENISELNKYSVIHLEEASPADDKYFDTPRISYLLTGADMKAVQDVIQSRLKK